MNFENIFIIIPVSGYHCIVINCEFISLSFSVYNRINGFELLRSNMFKSLSMYDFVSEEIERNFYFSFDGCQRMFAVVVV